jgi:site-specific recombinase XerD
MAHVRYIIKGAPNKAGKQIIFLRLTNKGEVTYFSTGTTINPEYWDFRNNKVKQAYKGFTQFNMYLDKFRQRIEDLVHQALSQEIEPTVEYIRSQVKQKEEKKAEKPTYVDFFTFTKEFIGTATINRKKSTITSYKTTVKHLREFEKYSGTTLTFDSFNMDFYFKFNYYIVEVLGCGNNSFGKQIRTLKSMLNAAIERGHKVNPAFKSKKFKTISEDVDNIYLNELEIKKLFDLDLSNNQRLEHVRNLFVCASCTGLRWSDFTEIKPENIRNGYIYIQTIKTQTRVVIPLHPYVESILKKYSNNLPPAISNQNMNAYLKELGEMAGLNDKITICRSRGARRVETTYLKHQLITTHTARRSFATNLFKQGVSPITIMLITGHRTEKSFMKYIKIKEEEAAFHLKQHWEKFYGTPTSPLYKIA